MANILGDDKQQQVLALGRLGWPLRRIEAATGVRRETASAYLKAAGIPVRARRVRRRPPAPNPASQVSTDFGGPSGQSGNPLPPWPPAAPSRAPDGQRLRALPGADRAGPRPGPQRHGDLAGPRRSTTASPGGTPACGASSRKLRGSAAPEAHPVIVTAPGRGRPGRLRRRGRWCGIRRTGKYRRTRLFVFTLGYSRKSVRLLTFESSARRWAELHEESVPPARRGGPGRRPRQPHARACSRRTSTIRR